MKRLIKKDSTLIIGGDFNLNLLKLNEREKLQEYFDLFVANGAIPQITMPTRFSRRNDTLIDHIFCKFSKNSSIGTSGIIITKLSDHLPCFSIINLDNNIKSKTKYIKIHKNGQQEVLAFQNEVRTQIEKMKFNTSLLHDPNVNYEKLEKIITNAKKKCFPVKVVKFNKYRHKLSPWITDNILNEIKFRDKLYIKWKKCPENSQNYNEYESSYKSYCSILQKNIRLAKRIFYHEQFEKYKTDIKKT